jgi:hypothetical protein
MRILSVSLLSAATLLLVGNPRLAIGQGRGMVIKDSATAVSITYPQLFGNIKLSPDQEAKAKVLIWHTQSAQTAAVREPNGYDKIIQLQAVRDSALSALLTNDADRAALEANAAKVRPRPVRPHRN